MLRNQHGWFVVQRTRFAWLPVTISGVLLAASYASTARNVVEFPGNARGAIGWILAAVGSTIMGDVALWIILLGSLAIATSEWWLPRARQAAPWVGARSTDLMTLVQLRDLAAKRSIDILALMRGLDEAGTRGLLRFYGRRVGDLDIDIMRRDTPRAPVPQEAWDNMRVAFNEAMEGSCADNGKTALYKRNPYSEKVFADVHVEVRQARKWLRREAQQFTDNSEGDHEKRPK